MLNLPGPVPVKMTRDGLDDWIITTVGGALGSPSQLRLFANNLTPSPASVLADFIEATFSGYAAIPLLALNWPAAKTMPDGSALSVHALNSTFLDTGPGVPNTVYGWYLTDAGGFLLASCRFDAAKVMDDVGKFITLELALNMPAAAPESSCDVTSNG